MSSTINIELTATQIRILALTGSDQLSPTNPEHLARFAEAWEKRWDGLSIDNSYVVRIMECVDEYLEKHQARLSKDLDGIKGGCITTVNSYQDGVPHTARTDILERALQLRIDTIEKILVKNRTYGSAEFEYRYGTIAQIKPANSASFNSSFIYMGYNISLALLNSAGEPFDPTASAGASLPHDRIDTDWLTKYEMGSAYLPDQCPACGKPDCVSNFASANSIVTQMFKAISTREQYALLEHAMSQRVAEYEKRLDPGDFLDVNLGNARNLKRIDARGVILASNADPQRKDQVKCDISTKILRRAGHALAYLAIRKIKGPYNPSVVVLGGVLTTANWLASEMLDTLNEERIGNTQFVFSDYSEFPALIGGAILAR